MRNATLGVWATLSFLSVLGPAHAQGVRLEGTASGTTVGLALSNGGDLSIANPSLRLAFRTEPSRFSAVFGRVSFNKSPISFEQVQTDLSLLDQAADRTTVRGTLGASGRLSRLTRGTLSFSARDVDFDPTSDELVPYTDYNVSGSLTYNRSPITSYDLSANIGQFDGAGVNESKSLSGQLTGGISHQLDNRTTATGTLGFAYINTEETQGGIRDDEWNLSVLFGAGFNYQLSDGSVGLGLSQTVGPSATGQLAFNTGLNADFTRQLTQAETIGLSLAISRQETITVGTPVSETFVTLSPSYTRQLNSDIRETVLFPTPIN